MHQIHLVRHLLFERILSYHIVILRHPGVGEDKLRILHFEFIGNLFDVKQLLVLSLQVLVVDWVVVLDQRLKVCILGV